MTLLLTEVSPRGIALLSDTKIMRVNRANGVLVAGIPPTYQRKLFKLPPLGPLKLTGAVSYWGWFGLIIEKPEESACEAQRAALPILS